IRELNSAKDLKKIAEDVLPELEKFLESPAEKRLRRVRKGVVISGIGLGAGLGFLALALATRNPESVFLMAVGMIVFFVGIAFIVNGYLHTVPKGEKQIHDETAKFVASSLGCTTSDLKLPEGEPARPFRSVTEGTTTHLGEKIRR
ncbi:MAG TPA: DUF6249 domain-containing protein, partial [Pyrinomonadaceae bacterium]|nr:DUF6249 domain-containing protein [Pyrinomonadaceae bacterium]